MATFWTGLAETYRPAARSRRNQVPLRLFVILVLCAILAWRPGFQFFLAWAAAYLVVQIAEIAALRRFLSTPAPGRSVLFNLASDVAMSVVFGAVAIPMWQVGTPVAAAGATLLLAGSVFTALMGAEGCKAGFLASGTPHLVYLFVLPLAGGSAHEAYTPFFLVGVALLALVVVMVFGWSRRAMEAERAARRAAEAQTAAKSAFVAMVSHELRTPINAILNGAAALNHQGSRACGPEGDREAASLILDAGAMMKSLLNDLLDFSKIEAGRMGVETIDHDLRVLVGDTVRFWRGEAKAKGVDLRMHGAHALPEWVRGDPMRVRQILNNLLSNAIKFTSEGEVALFVEVCPPEATGRMMRIAVVDTGPGLTETQLGQLFNAYDQLDNGVARTFGGTGLGLAISRDLARLMGGDLIAAGDDGGGARFTLVLPVIEGSAPAQDLGGVKPVLEAVEHAPLMLVVDDHDINRRTLRGMLEAFGARVETAEDAEAALRAAEERVFDAILMDVRMPGVDGLEATRRLRAQGLNQQTPVIAVTGGASSAEVEACRAAGMTGLVEKPVGAAELYEALFGKP